MLQSHLVAKRGETGREMAAEFFVSVFLSYLKVYLTRREILRHGANDFTFSLISLIARKNPSLSAGFEPANGKHVSHYTAEAISMSVYLASESVAAFWLESFQLDLCNVTSKQVP
jgi:hypothetical protein